MSLATAIAFVEDLDPFIAHLEGTAEDAWQVDVVRSADGTRNCMFGHLFQFAYDHQMAAGATPEVAERFASHAWQAFEEGWATTYMVYPVNDGTNPAYGHDTPKERVLAYLRALAAGTQRTTTQIMEDELDRYEESLQAGAQT